MSIDKITLWFDRFDQKFDAVPDIVAETAVEHFKERFIQKNWEGVPWAPYQNKKREPTAGSLMMRSTNLFKSVRPSVILPSEVVISAGSPKIPYARIHNEGGRVTGRFGIRPYTNKNFMGKGKPVQIRAHTRNVDFSMPRRQFIGVSRTLNNRILERIKAHYNSI